MTKEPQPTTHNAERGARGTCREGSETGLFPTVWRKHLARYVGVLEETCSVLRRTLIRRSSVKKCVGDLEKKPFDDFGDFGENCSAKLWSVIWRNRSASFGENR